MASKNRKVRAIEVEAARQAAADGKSSRAERLAIRNELRAAQGMGTEKRKRGGLAGTWDRNKAVIKPIVTGVAGAFGTPALAAGLGALMGGLDRPGKSGVGFDVGRGLRGAGEGALAGAAGAGVRGMFTGPGFSAGRFLPAARDYAYDIPGVKRAFTSTPITSATEGVANANLTGLGGSPAGNFARGAGRFLAKNPTVIGQAATAVGSGMQAAGQRAMARDEMNYRRQQDVKRERDRERLASMFKPTFDRLVTRLGGTF